MSLVNHRGCAEHSLHALCGITLGPVFEDGTKKLDQGAPIESGPKLS